MWQPQCLEPFLQFEPYSAMDETYHDTFAGILGIGPLQPKGIRIDIEISMLLLPHAECSHIYVKPIYSVDGSWRTQNF